MSGNIAKKSTSNRIPEIDGLRAIALLMILLYHFKFSFLPFPGGFLGVDVFFVISGFVITRKIWHDMKESRFEIFEFYKSRIVRLFPAFFVTLVGTSFFAVLILLPDEISNYASSYFSSFGLMSNIYFWRTTGYFNPSVDFLPLIHIWSLSIEEQFYLIFPFAMLLLFKSRKSPRIILSLLFVTSLFVYLFFVNSFPVATFYLLPFRIWEFVLGSVIAINLQKIRIWPSRKNILLEFLSIISLLVILVVNIYLYQFPIDPQYSQLIVVLGTGILLFVSTGTRYMSNFLNSWPLQSVGLVSYSIYLVHQPVLVLWRNATSRELTDLEKVYCLVLTLILGYAIAVWVERPVRRMYAQNSHIPLISKGFLASILIFVVVGGLLTSSSVTSRKYSNEQKKILAFKSGSNQPDYGYGKCFLGSKSLAKDFSPGCLSMTGKGRRTLLIGDSHAAMISLGLESRIENLSRLSFTGCFALAASEILPSHCNPVFQRYLETIKFLKPDNIVIAGSWLNGSFRTKFGERALLSSISNTIQLIHKSSPESVIFIVGNSPQWSPNLPSVLVRKNIPLKDGEMIFSPDLAEMKVLDRKINDSIQYGRVIFIDLLEHLCTEKGLCRGVGEYNGKIEPFVFDDSHTTNFGSSLIAEIIYQQLSKVK